MSGDKVRRGVTFGGFALVMGIVILPLALNVFWSGPVPPLMSAFLWLIIVSLTIFGFYLGFSGWGRSRDY